MDCPLCGTLLDGKHCLMCNYTRPDNFKKKGMKFCKNCHEELTKKDSKCPGCGKKIRRIDFKYHFGCLVMLIMLAVIGGGTYCAYLYVEKHKIMAQERELTEFEQKMVDGINFIEKLKKLLK